MTTASAPSGVMARRLVLAILAAVAAIAGIAAVVSTTSSALAPARRAHEQGPGLAAASAAFLDMPMPMPMASNPKDVARMVGDAFLRNSAPPSGPLGCLLVKPLLCGMMGWEYGAALIMDSMLQAAAQFGFDDWLPQLDAYLDGHTESLLSPGYYLARNITMPFDSSVGDNIGLYPIAYLQRAIRKNSTASGRDAAIAKTTADHYILKWPHRLADGTFSRTTRGNWAGEESSKTGSILWGDDQTMGTLLVARMAPIYKNAEYAAEVTRQQIGFARRLRDPSDGLNFHGYNEVDGHTSCCKWGRANGWGMLGHAEALQSMQAWPDGYPNATANAELVDIFRRHAAAAKASQAPDGRWHQLLNDSSSGSFLETSASAMFTTAIARGIRMGVLNKTEYSPVVERGWQGLLSTILPDGTVTGVSCATDIEGNARAYYWRPRFFFCSGPGGAGALLYAAMEMAKGY